MGISKEKWDRQRKAMLHSPFSQGNIFSSEADRTSAPKHKTRRAFLQRRVLGVMS
jgi:hypothetical protein